MRKILIVEDEKLLREGYELILSTEPYDIHTAENGADALHLCKTNDYDLILLDLMMPIMDGVEFLEHYSRDSGNQPVIIVLSNLSTGRELDTALSLGASKHFIKANLSPRQLISMVRYELQKNL